MTAESEIKWEGRLWTFFQIGMVALVGYLTLQAVETQRILAQIVTESRYTNARLEKIEAQLERGIESRYSNGDARRDFEGVARSITALEVRIRSLEVQGQRQAQEIYEIRRRIGAPNGREMGGP